MQQTYIEKVAKMGTEPSRVITGSVLFFQPKRCTLSTLEVVDCVFFLRYHYDRSTDTFSHQHARRPRDEVRRPHNGRRVGVLIGMQAYTQPLAR